MEFYGGIMLPNKTALEIIKKYITKFKKGGDLDNFKEELIKCLLDYNLLVKTEDGTHTLVSENKEELMHSKIGSLREGVEKFVMPSDLEKMKNPKILDLCSGMTYNSIAALHFNKNCSIDMIECCKEVLFLSMCIDVPYREHGLIKEKLKNFFRGNCEGEYKINIYANDARKVIKKLNNKYNVVFHDAFSPQRDSVLYTLDFLKKLYEKMEDNSILISYSSSIPFRSALVSAGFVISEGESIGRKRGITIGYKNPSPDRVLKRISLTDERLIALSTVGIPYRDVNLNLTHEEIVKNRYLERIKMKEKLLKMGKYYPTKKVKLGKIDKKFLDIQDLNLNSSEIILKMRELLEG